MMVCQRRGWRWTLWAAVVVFGLRGSGTAAATASADRQSSTSWADAFRFVPRDSAAACVFYPRKLFASETVRRLPAGYLLADMKRAYGIDVSQLEQVVAFVVPSAEGRVYSTGVVLAFHDAVDWRRMPPKLLDQTEFGEINGKPYRRGRREHDFSVFSENPRLLVIAPDGVLRKILDEQGPAIDKRSVVDRLQAAIDRPLDLHLVANLSDLKPVMTRGIGEFGGGAEPWQAFAHLADVSDRLEVRIRLSQELALGAILECDESHSIEELRARYANWSLAMRSAENEPLIGAPAPADPNAGATGSVTRIDSDHDATSSDRFWWKKLGVLATQLTPSVVGDQLQLGLRGDGQSQAFACASVLMLMPPVLDATPSSVDWLLGTEVLQHPQTARR